MILPRVKETINWFWIDNPIYWTLQLTNHYYTQTSVLSHVAWQRLPTIHIPWLPGSRAAPGSQLPTSPVNSQVKVRVTLRLAV
jgi:hypothetical protein